MEAGVGDQAGEEWWGRDPSHLHTQAQGIGKHKDGTGDNKEQHDMAGAVTEK